MEIPKVKQFDDNLIKDQWGRNFLYKKDGLKETLVAQRFVMVIVILFAVIILCLLFQGGVGLYNQSPKSRSDI